MRKWRTNIVFIIIFTLRLLASCGFHVRGCYNETNKHSDHKYWGKEYYENIRYNASDYVRRYIPSPHSELLLGILLGINDLKRVPRFNDVLIETGTVHVVVVSGYNISLLAEFVSSLVKKKRSVINFIITESAITTYTALAGFDPPVIRAWMLASLTHLISLYGRKIDKVQILVFVAPTMLIVKPLLIFDLSFQLSFLSYLGISLLSSYVSKFHIVVHDFFATIAAQIFVWPIIAYRFGRISVISPLVNSFVLWTVPFSTILGFVFIFSLLIGGYISKVSSYIVFPFLDIFVFVTSFFSKWRISAMQINVSLSFMVCYYAIVLAVFFYMKKREKI